jgi:hypothetical protein
MVDDDLSRASQPARPAPDPSETLQLPQNREPPMKRPVRAMQVSGIEPQASDAPKPTFEWVDPAILLVDEAYQRNLSDRSITLIRKIVGDWDWRRFKPPVVAKTGDGYEVIDGQHTAIAAASHPDIDTIPVMVVDAAEQSDRAAAFIGHNRDRIAITATQLHVAAVAAGDPEAMTVQAVCERAGLKILKNPPGQGIFKPRDTMAVKAINALINRRGAMKARQFLEVLAAAECAPVAAHQIKAVEMCLTDPEYADQLVPADLTTFIRAKGFIADQEAKVFAAAHNVPVWRALGITYFKGARRGRRRAN